MRSRVLLAALLVAAVAGFASGEHSASPCASEVTTFGAGEHALYLVQGRGEEGTWIYAESNGHPGLQRGGAAWYEIGTSWDPDMCWDVKLATGEQIEDPDFIVL